MRLLVVINSCNIQPIGPIAPRAVPHKMPRTEVISKKGGYRKDRKFSNTFVSKKSFCL